MFPQFSLLRNGLLVTLVLSSANIAFSQQYDIAYTLNYINSRLQNCDVSMNKKNAFLTVTYYSKGEKARVDQLFSGDVEVSGIAYVPEEGAIIVRCAAKYKDCVKREILTRNAISYYPRTTLTVSCENNDCTSLVNAVKHLIYLHTFDGYTRSKPFDENDKPEDAE